MQNESKIVLNCPECDAAIYAMIDWFKQSDFVCQSCGKGLTAAQFAPMIADLEQAIDTRVDEMISEQPHTGCCGKKSTCS